MTHALQTPDIVHVPAAPPLLCEACGYPLPTGEVQPDAACSECGEPVAASLPHHRTGPAWQRRMSLGSWAETAIGSRPLPGVLRSPRRFFRAMRIDGENLPARLFLVSQACVAGTMAGLCGWLVLGRSALVSWMIGMLCVKAILVMSYVEALGVTFFSRQRGWRVPFHLAERIVGYASVGWVVSVTGLSAGLALLPEQGWGIDALLEWVVGLPYAAWNGWLVFRMLALAALQGAMLLALLLPFESLVYRGVRQCRYANAASV